MGSGKSEAWEGVIKVMGNRGAFKDVGRRRANWGDGEEKMDGVNGGEWKCLR